MTLAIRKRPLLVTGISALAALAAVVCCYLVTRTMYFQEMLQVYVAGGILRHPLNRVINLGELVMNAPISKLPEISELMLVAAGISFLSLISSAIVLRRGAWSAIDVYCASYLAIIIAWPYNGARFLLPIGPIVFLYLMMIYTRLLRVRILKWILCFHLLVFSGLGIAALGFSTRISLARDTFPDVYGDGTLTPTYHEVFGTREVPRQDIHSDAAKLLLRYERRCGRVSRENHRQPAFDIPLERRYD